MRIAGERLFFPSFLLVCFPLPSPRESKPVGNDTSRVCLRFSVHGSSQHRVLLGPDRPELFPRSATPRTGGSGGFARIGCFLECGHPVANLSKRKRMGGSAWCRHRPSDSHDTVACKVPPIWLADEGRTTGYQLCHKPPRRGVHRSVVRHRAPEPQVRPKR